MQHPNEDKPTSELPQRKMRVVRYEPGQAPDDPTKILKYLWDRIVQECGVTPQRWNKLCDSYIKLMEVERGERFPNPVEAKASINKNFGSAEKMTFKNLCKALVFLRVRRAKLTLTLEHASGAYTEHSLWQTINKSIVQTEDLDYDPQVPRETTIETNDFSPPPGIVRPVPPPELSRFAGKYPPSVAPRSGEDSSGA